jgi:hypothetical protein
MTWECENKTPVSARDATSAGTAQGVAVTHEALALLRDEGHYLRLSSRNFLWIGWP